MKLGPIAEFALTILLIGLTPSFVFCGFGQAESLADFARRMRACKNFPPLCKSEGVEGAVRQLEPLDKKQLSMFVLKFKDFDKDFPKRGEWEETLFASKQAFVKAYYDMVRIKESCNSKEGSSVPGCYRNLAQRQETLENAKSDFLEKVEVG